MTHPSTIVGHTLDGSLICPDCSDKLDTVGSACGQPLDLFDPGWHTNCPIGKDPSGSPCHVISRASYDGSGDDVSAVFEDSCDSWNMHGHCCADCGMVLRADDDSPVEWLSSEDFRALSRYVAGSNMPGYLPDGSDMVLAFEDTEDARQYILDEIERAADDADSIEPTDMGSALAGFAEDINLERGTFERIGPDGRAYFVTDTMADDSAHKCTCPLVWGGTAREPMPAPRRIDPDCPVHHTAG